MPLHVENEHIRISCLSIPSSNDQANPLAQLDLSIDRSRPGSVANRHPPAVATTTPNPHRGCCKRLAETLEHRPRGMRDRMGIVIGALQRRRRRLPEQRIQMPSRLRAVGGSGKPFPQGVSVESPFKELGEFSDFPTTWTLVAIAVL